MIKSKNMSTGTNKRRRLENKDDDKTCDKDNSLEEQEGDCGRCKAQRKIKGQQLKGKIVSEISHFSHFFVLFQKFSPRTLPFKTKGFSSRRTKEKKRK